MEAIATYFQTIQLDERAGTVELGAPSDDFARALHSDFGPMPMSRMLACNNEWCWVTDTFYPTAWLLFSYLVNNHEARLLKYMQRLIETPTGDQSKLWSEVLTDLPASTLDHELSVWLATGEIRIQRFHVDLRQWPVTQRTLNDADVLAVRGLLRYLRHPHESVPDETRQAVRADPTNVIARLTELAQRPGALSSSVAKTIVEAHPADWRAWWCLWNALAPGQEADEAHHKVCTLLPLNPGWLPAGFCPA